MVNLQLLLYLGFLPPFLIVFLVAAALTAAAAKSQTTYQTSSRAPVTFSSFLTSKQHNCFFQCCKLCQWVIKKNAAVQQ